MSEDLYDKKIVGGLLPDVGGLVTKYNAIADLITPVLQQIIAGTSGLDVSTTITLQGNPPITISIYSNIKVAPNESNFSR